MQEARQMLMRVEAEHQQHVQRLEAEKDALKARVQQDVENLRSTSHHQLQDLATDLAVLQEQVAVSEQALAETKSTGKW